MVDKQFDGSQDPDEQTQDKTVHHLIDYSAIKETAIACLEKATQPNATEQDKQRAKESIDRILNHPKMATAIDPYFVGDQLAANINPGNLLHSVTAHHPENLTRGPPAAERATDSMGGLDTELYGLQSKSYKAKVDDFEANRSDRPQEANDRAWNNKNSHRPQRNVRPLNPNGDPFQAMESYSKLGEDGGKQNVAFEKISKSDPDYDPNKPDKVWRAKPGSP